MRHMLHHQERDPQRTHPGAKPDGSEERWILVPTFGAEYERYRSRVGAFFPRRTRP